MNKESIANECPRCLEVEDWEYVLLYITNEEVHYEFLFRLKARLIELEDADQVAHEIMTFISDISQYSKGGDEYRTL